jgi:5-methylcytosine-specific restriction enzyme A
MDLYILAAVVAVLLAALTAKAAHLVDMLARAKRDAGLIAQPKEISGSGWRAGKTSTERGYGYKWQQAREGYLRLHPVCVMCDAEGKVTVATVVDHITPHKGDQVLFWDQSNWQSLCTAHHSGDKQAQERTGRVKRGVGPDGWPASAGPTSGTSTQPATS